MNGIKKTISILICLILGFFSYPQFVHADFSQYLVDEMKKEEGDCGRLIIPDLSISVALYDINNKSSDEGQKITDDDDSAAWCYNQAYYGHPCRVAIADHNFQGFERIAAAVPGVTNAYLLKDGILSEYLCKAKYSGYNKLKYVSDAFGNDIIDLSSKDIIVYTCKFGWEVIDIIELMPLF